MVKERYVQDIPARNGECRNIPKDNISDFILNSTPPPPPGTGDLWELQFCRWWGWNWVRKREEHQKGQGQRQIEEQKVQKKHFKDLCNCLRFKKRPKETPSLQKLYNTPSNSVVLCETYTCGLIETRNDSVSHLEEVRNVSRKTKRQICIDKHNEVQSWVKDEESSSSCSDDCECYKREKTRSTTQESLEYLKVNCCHCCQPNEHEAPKKCDCQTQTFKNVKVANAQTSHLKSNIGATQTSKNLKKKRLQLVCCHCCCCRCCCNRSNEEKRPKKEENHIENPKVVVEPPKIQDYCAATVKIDARNRFEELCHLEQNRWQQRNPTYLNNFRPWDTMLYDKKSFSKFGVPSKKYPWVQNTMSDVMDKIYSLKLNEEFSSPVTGKVYDFSHENVDSFDNMTTSTLPDPIAVDEDIQYLRDLEKQVKTDLESRVMLDAICDAILAKHKKNETRSSFLNEYTYSVNSESKLKNLEMSAQSEDDTNCDSLIENNEDQTITDSLLVARRKFEKNCSLQRRASSQIHACTSSQQTDDQTILQQVEELVKKLLATNTNENLNSKHKVEKADLKISVEDSSKRKADIPENISCCLKENVDRPVISNTYPPLTKSGLMPIMRNTKRNASPVLDKPLKKLKKIKSKNGSADSLATNVSDVFRKIDEIATRSNAYDEKIQYVLNSIPKDYNDTERVVSSGPVVISNVSDLASDMKKFNHLEILNKIDEIIVKSQVNDDGIQNVINTIPRKSDAPKDYVNSEQLISKLNSSQICPKSKLSTISESSGEKLKKKSTNSCEGPSDVGKKVELGTDKELNIKKIKKVSRQSLIPIKHTNTGKLISNKNK